MRAVLLTSLLCTSGAVLVPCSKNDACDCEAMGTPCTYMCASRDACAGAKVRCGGAEDCEVSCTDDRSCKGGHVQCTGSQDCDVTCSGRGACSSLVGDANGIDETSQFGLYCGEHVKDCRIDCSGQKSCKNTDSFCASSECHTLCTSKEACRQATATCVGEKCSMNCAASKACYKATLQWSLGKAADVYCSTSEACRDATVVCPENDNCNVICSGYQACKNLRLRCPQSLPEGKKCQILCTGFHACEGVTEISGEVTAVCEQGACSRKLLRHMLLGAPTSCHEPTPRGLDFGVTKAWCEAVCIPSPDNEACVAGPLQLCTCEKAPCSWTITRLGREEYVTPSWCAAVCTSQPENSACVPSPDQFCQMTCEPTTSPMPSVEPLPVTVEPLPATRAPTTSPPHGNCRWMTASPVVGDLWCNLFCGSDPRNAICTSTDPNRRLCHCSTPLPAPAACRAHDHCQCPDTGLCEFRCDEYKECYHSEMECGASDCHVTCSGGKACYKGSIDCMQGSEVCDVVCSGFDACTHLSPVVKDGGGGGEGARNLLPCGQQTASADFAPGIRCGMDTKNCNVACLALQSCTALHLLCDSVNCNMRCNTRACTGIEQECNGNCRAKCDGFDACAGAIFNWQGADETAELQCTSQRSCAGATIECPASGCVIKCTGYKSCQGMVLKCPDTLEPGKRCEIRCDGDAACEGMEGEKLCGIITPRCSGFRACPRDLLKLVPPVHTPTCNWIPTATGILAKYTPFVCAALCGSPLTSHVCKPSPIHTTMCTCGDGNGFTPGEAESPLDHSCTTWRPLPAVVLPIRNGIYYCNHVCNADLVSTLCMSSGFQQCECDESVMACYSRSECKCRLDSTPCGLQCDERRECYDSSLVCGNGNCDVQCSGEQACSKGSITCTSGSPKCNIVCSGDESCKSLDTREPEDEAPQDSQGPQDDQSPQDGQSPQDDQSPRDEHDRTLKSVQGPSDEVPEDQRTPQDEQSPVEKTPQDERSPKDDEKACRSIPTLDSSFTPALQCGAETIVCNIDCSGVSACEHTPMRCDSEVCELTCSEKSSCMEAAFQCRGQERCVAACAAPDACRQTAFEWSGAKDMTLLKCTATHSCEGAVIECPNDNCKVVCSGMESCRGLTLKCPERLAPGKTCEIECSGEWSCVGIKSDNICGEVSARCTGFEACEEDLLKYDTVDPECPNWQPVPVLHGIGILSHFCNHVCRLDSASPICTASTAFRGFQLCECSTRSVPTPVPTTSEGPDDSTPGDSPGDSPMDADAPHDVEPVSVPKDVPQGMAPMNPVPVYVPADAPVEHTPKDSAPVPVDAADTPNALDAPEDVDSTPMPTPVPTASPGTLAPPICNSWRPMPDNGGINCNAICVNAATDVVCTGVRGIAQLCECVPCTEFAPKEEHADCNTLCFGVHDMGECSRLCKCVDTPTPTTAATPAPGGEYQRIIRRVFRFRLRLLRELFNLERFETALTSALMDYVSGVEVHWTCPASACLFGCPSTEAMKLALGCTSHVVVNARGGHVLEANGTVVEVSFKYKPGSSEEDAHTALLQDTHDTLAEFGVISIEIEETEVVVKNPNHVQPEDESDRRLSSWVIGLVVALAIFVACVAVCLYTRRANQAKELTTQV